MNLVLAEWRKLSTTRLLWILIAASLAFVALSVALLVLVAPTASPIPGLDPLLDTGYLTSVVGSAASASLFVLILGIVGLTSEYRHMTITSAFLATPRRGSVLIAKGVLFAAIGAVIGVIATIWSLGITLFTLSFRDHAPLDSGAIVTLGLGVVLGMALYAVLGVSVGALIKNQVAAIVTAVGFVMLVEPLLSALVAGLYKWLPGGALSAAMNTTTNTQDLSTADILPVWGGALLLVAYAVAFGAIAAVTTLRRDIT